MLDRDKEGEEEADPYVLAMARELRRMPAMDVRIVTEDVKTTVLKMPLAGAAGYFGIPSAPLRVFAKFEGFREWA